MASINNSFNTHYFTSDLPVVNISTTQKYVNVYIYNDDEQECFAQLKLYPYNGQAKLYDMQQIVESYMLQHSLCCMSLTVRADDNISAYKSTVVVYSKYHFNTDARQFLKENFLTTARYKTIYPNTREYLVYAMIQDEDSHNDEIDLRINYRKADGTMAHITLSCQVGCYLRENFCYISFTLDDIDNRIANGQAVSIFAEKGGRQMQYFISRTQPTCRFLFRNTFNAIETIAFNGVTKEKTDVSNATAAMGNRLSFYDSKVEKTFETQTAPLTIHQCRHLESLILSKKAFLIEEENAVFDYLAGDDDGTREILITDSDYAISDTDESPNTIKLTWKFAYNVPQFRQSLEEIGLAPASTFTEVFDITFKK